MWTSKMLKQLSAKSKEGVYVCYTHTTSSDTLFIILLSVRLCNVASVRLWLFVLLN